MDATVTKHVNNPIYAGTGVVPYLRRLYITNCCTEREAQWIGYIQSLGPPRLRRFLTKAALCCSFFGEGPAYIILLCWLIWGDQPIIGYYFSISLSMGLLMTHSLKDLMGCPRPYSPPVTKHTADVTHTTEYGFPSTHTACGAILAHTAAASFITGGLVDRTQAALIASFFVGAIGASRVYLGMHWTGDVVIGFSVFLFWAVCHMTFLPVFVDYIAFQIPITSWSMFFLPFLFGQWVLNIHAAPKEACPCFEDSARFLGANVGSMLGFWYNRVVRAPKLGLDAYQAQTPTLVALPFVYTLFRLFLGLAIVILAQDTFSKWCIRPLAAFLRFAAGGYSHAMPEALRPIYRICCAVFGLVVFFRAPNFNAAVVDGSTQSQSVAVAATQPLVGAGQEKMVKAAASKPQQPQSSSAEAGGASISASGGTLNLTVPPSPDATPANDGGENALPLRTGAAAAAASASASAASGHNNNNESNGHASPLIASPTAPDMVATSHRGGCCGGASSSAAAEKGSGSTSSGYGTVWSLRTHNHWDQSRNSMKYLSYILLSFLTVTFVSHVAFPIVDVPLLWLHTF